MLWRGRAWVLSMLSGECILLLLLLLTDLRTNKERSGMQSRVDLRAHWSLSVQSTKPQNHRPHSAIIKDERYLNTTTAARLLPSLSCICHEMFLSLFEEKIQAGHWSHSDFNRIITTSSYFENFLTGYETISDASWWPPSANKTISKKTGYL